MARIRTIKPDFWTNEKVLSIEPITRLLFIGMWNFADDYGRMAYEPLGLKAKVFPNDSIMADAIKAMLNELLRADLIIVYTANGREYIEITGWDHQRIDRRQASKIPAPFSEGCHAIRRPFDEHSTNPPDHSTSPAPVREGKGMEGNGREKKETREVALLSAGPSEFEIFWAQWPNKVGKPAAMKALASALKRGGMIFDICDGVQRYIRDKPPDRPWLNPATFLNQNRWEDQPAKVQHGKLQTDNPRAGSLIAALDRALEQSIAQDANRAASENVVLMLPARPVSRPGELSGVARADLGAIPGRSD